MPYEFSVVQLAGRDVVRVVGSGKLVAADAAQMLDRTGPGGENAFWPQISIMMPGADVTAEARKVFAERSKRLFEDNGGAVESLVAVVIESVVMRVTAQFLTKIAPGKHRVGFFKAEPEALVWLEAQIVDKYGLK